MSPGARRGRRGTREPGAERKGPEVDAVQPGGDSGVAGGREPAGLDQRGESRGPRPGDPPPPPPALYGRRGRPTQGREGRPMADQRLPAPPERGGGGGGGGGRLFVGPPA